MLLPKKETFHNINIYSSNYRLYTNRTTTFFPYLEIIYVMYIERLKSNQSLHHRYDELSQRTFDKFVLHICATNSFYIIILIIIIQH